MHRVILLAFAILFVSSCKTPPDEQRDSALVGVWEGARVGTENCQNLAWQVHRTADGKYVVQFFEDQSRKTQIGEEQGVWWTKDGIFFEQAPKLMTEPDSYKYTVLDAKTVQFQAVSFDSSSDCKGDYSFIDHLISR